MRSHSAHLSGYTALKKLVEKPLAALIQFIDVRDLVPLPIDARDLPSSGPHFMRRVPPISNEELCPTSVGFDLEPPHATLVFKPMDPLDDRGEVPPVQLRFQEFLRNRVESFEIRHASDFVAGAILNDELLVGLAEWKQPFHPRVEHDQTIEHLGTKVRGTRLLPETNARSRYFA